MELETEIEKHKKTRQDMEKCIFGYYLSCSERGGCDSCGREDSAMLEGWRFGRELLFKGSFL